MRRYLLNYEVEKALECAKKKKLMYFQLHGKVDLITIADLAEIAFEQGFYHTAIKYANEALQNVLPLHAVRVRFYCILIRAYFYAG